MSIHFDFRPVIGADQVIIVFGSYRNAKKNLASNEKNIPLEPAHDKNHEI